MLVQKKLPSVISDDIITWLKKTGVPRMNRNALSNLGDESEIGSIELDIGGNIFNFNSAELAPPTGAMAVNYSRYSFLIILLLC